MTRVVALLLLAGSLAAAPVPKELKAKLDDLAGTTWKGQGICGDTVYTFEKDGRLTYSYGTSCWRNGTWKQEGDKLYWEVNRKYAEFEGVVKGGVITGRSWNVAGGSWTLEYKKDPDARHPREPSEQVFPPGGR